MDNRAPDTCPLYISQVLLVENDTEAASLVSTGLALDNLGVTWVRSRKEAVEQLARNSFDLLLVDLGLPRARISESLKDFATEKNPSIPIVVLTGWGGVREKLESFEYGVVDYITK